ncbi:MAG: serine/threonine-protein kinase [Gemmatimonadales bacterium]
MSESVTPEFISLQRAVAGKYSLDRELGRGGMGVVFLARDVALDRPVAIKLLPPSLAGNQDFRHRFLVEARTAARLSHPNIVPIHAVEERGDLVFFVMAFIDGETLGQRVRRAGPLPSSQLMRMVQEVAWALGHAHANGVVHRDVKPDNIMLERGSGRAMVTDFGIARAASAGNTPGSGLPAGTPQYMSPEQAANGPVDGRADLYALGVTAFYAATGRLPYESDNAAGYIAQHALAPIPSVNAVNPLLPIRFSRAVERCLAKDPAARFDSADELAEAVRDARGPVVDIPAPVRGYVRDADAAGSEIGTLLGAAGVSVAALGVVFGFNDWVASLVLLPATGLLAGLGAIRFGQVLYAARRLRRQGYDLAAVRPALALEDRNQAEEEALSPLARKGIRRETIIGTGIGIIKTAVATWLATADVNTVLAIAGAAGMVILPTMMIRTIWRDVRRGKSLWRRMLQGRLGRLIFGIAGLGLWKTPLLPTGGEPTEVMLGAAAGELFAALPAADRRQLAEVPALVERLQREAEALRMRGGDAAVERLPEVVGALEAIRLDLLRMHAGQAGLDEITRDLEAARNVGARIDAEVEIRGLLEPSGETT